MRLRRFEKIATLIKSVSVIALLFMSACATQQTQDVSIDEQIETMKQIENVEENSASVFVKQDMGLLSLHERNEKEALRNLQIELSEEQLRIPANEETAQEETKEEPVKAEEAANTESAQEVKETAQEEQSKEHEQFAMPSNTNDSKLEVLSKEEMSQELFDAESVVVQKGDSLSALAEKHLGNKRAWARIWSINPNIQNPNIIEVGTKLYIPKNADRSVASTQEAAPAPVKEEVAVVAPQAAPEVVSKAAPEAAPPVEAPKITDLAPKVEVKIAEKVEAVAAPIASPATPVENKTTISGVVNTGGSSHTLDELLWEHIETKRANKYKGKDLPVQNLTPRKISSVNDAGPDEEIKVATTDAPKALSKVISLAGFLLLLGVLAGFFFSKPKNQ